MRHRRKDEHTATQRPARNRLPLQNVQDAEDSCPCMLPEQNCPQHTDANKKSRTDSQQPPIREFSSEFEISLSSISH